MYISTDWLIDFSFFFGTFLHFFYKLYLTYFTCILMFLFCKIIYHFHISKKVLIICIKAVRVIFFHIQLSAYSWIQLVYLLASPFYQTVHARYHPSVLINKFSSWILTTHRFLSGFPLRIDSWDLIGLDLWALVLKHLSSCHLVVIILTSIHCYAITVGPACSPPPVRALRLLPQCQGPNPPPCAVGESKTTDSSSQW